MKGPRPKPTALKLVQGRPGHHPINHAEPKPTALAKMPPPPDYIRSDARAAAMWRCRGPKFIAWGILTEADLETFGQMCAWHSQFVEAKIAGHPNQMSLAHKHLKALETEFGMTPSSRSRVKATPPATEDKFADFIAQGKK